MTDRLALKSSCRPQVVPIGASGEPVIIVDGVLAEPEALIEAACGLPFRAAGGWQGGYPGVRARAPSAYAETLVDAVEPLIRRVYALGDAVRGKVDASLSLVTTPRNALHPLQRVPHVDTCSPFRFALLHFLCGAEHGGTAFFRHVATGLEQIRPEAFEAYRQARRLESRSLPEPEGYPGPATPGFRQTAAFQAARDRLLIYRSFSLHSGIIPPGAALEADPRAGRLTANVFIDFEPAAAPPARG